jgi:hypothetical protein
MNFKFKNKFSLLASGLSFLASVAFAGESHFFDKSDDNVRVVLLKIDKSMNLAGGTPRIEIALTYLIEFLGVENITNRVIAGKEDQILSQNKSITDGSLKYSVGVSRWEHSEYNWDVLGRPALSVRDPKRTVIVERRISGTREVKGKLDIQLSVGFNAHIPTIKFIGVPID